VVDRVGRIGVNERTGGNDLFVRGILQMLIGNDVGEEDVGVDEDADGETAGDAEHAANDENQELTQVVPPFDRGRSSIACAGHGFQQHRHLADHRRRPETVPGKDRLLELHFRKHRLRVAA
jgi:hypothetical protein